MPVWPGAGGTGSRERHVACSGRYLFALAGELRDVDVRRDDNAFTAAMAERGVVIGHSWPI